jgi:hypothetical protein
MKGAVVMKKILFIFLTAMFLYGCGWFDKEGSCNYSSTLEGGPTCDDVSSKKSCLDKCSKFSGNSSCVFTEGKSCKKNN